jgi:hypothetical protein
MHQLVGIAAREAEVGGEQGDSLRQFNIRGGVIRLAGRDAAATASGSPPLAVMKISKVY